MPSALVSGFARDFLSGKPIAHAKISLFDGEKIIYLLNTDEQGKFYFTRLIGCSFSLILEKKGFRTTETAFITVPKNGLITPLTNITLQVPSMWVWHAFKWAMGAVPNDNACQVAATVTAFGKTLDVAPQGEANAKVSLLPEHSGKLFYFGMVPFCHKTNPFTRSLKQTSRDGGVCFINVKPSEQPYQILTEKKGVTFTTKTFFAREGGFVNLSPPHGPTVIINF